MISQLTHKVTDDLKKVARGHWMQSPDNRPLWRTLRETYVQQWSYTNCNANDDKVRKTPRDALLSMDLI